MVPSARKRWTFSMPQPPLNCPAPQEFLRVEEEVDRAWDLGIRSCPIQVQRVALAPHRELELYRAVAESVVVGVILELETLAFRDELADQANDAGARQRE